MFTSNSPFPQRHKQSALPRAGKAPGFFFLSKEDDNNASVFKGMMFVAYSTNGKAIAKMLETLNKKNSLVSAKQKERISKSLNDPEVTQQVVRQILLELLDSQLTIKVKVQEESVDQAMKNLSGFSNQIMKGQLAMYQKQISIKLVFLLIAMYNMNNWDEDSLRAQAREELERCW